MEIPLFHVEAGAFFDKKLAQMIGIWYYKNT
jgi:hypothetical protein